MGLDMFAYVTAEKLASAVDFRNPKITKSCTIGANIRTYTDGWKRFTSRRAGETALQHVAVDVGQRRPRPARSGD